MRQKETNSTDVAVQKEASGTVLGELDVSRSWASEATVILSLRLGYGSCVQPVEFFSPLGYVRLIFSLSPS